MLKKIVSFIVCIACMVSMTGVFAATYDATTTTYVSDGTIQVETTITGGEAGQVATYLVYKEGLEDAAAIYDGADIVYIDAYKFTGTEVGNSYTFTYRTDSSNVGAKIAMGADVALSGVPTVGGITVNVSVNGTQSTAVIDPVPESGATGDEWIKIPCAITGNVTAVEVADASITNYFTAADGIWVLDTAIPTNVTAFNAAITTDEAVDRSLATLGMTYIPAADDEDGVNQDSVIVVGQVVGSASEYGIVLRTSAEDTEGQLVLPALGKGTDGKFAIRVYDSEGFAAEKLYAVTYCVVDGAYQYAQTGKWVEIPAAE